MWNWTSACYRHNYIRSCKCAEVHRSSMLPSPHVPPHTAYVCTYVPCCSCSVSSVWLFSFCSSSSCSTKGRLALSTSSSTRTLSRRFHSSNSFSLFSTTFLSCRHTTHDGQHHHAAVIHTTHTHTHTHTQPPP